MASRDQLCETLDRLRGRLLAERIGGGWWTGRLASSALSTATACTALALVDPRGHAKLAAAGLQWLAENANADGGWGDTVRSRSNLSTTLLAWAAFGAAGDASVHRTTREKAEAWVRDRAGSLEPPAITDAVVDFYGKDRTFSAPILTMLALAGRLGPEAEAWRLVPPLPFELAALPQAWYRWLRLPVVSYALPALVAIGQVRHHFRPHWCPFKSGLRDLLRRRTLSLVERMQPASGGFLEAVPLTSFVAMSLAGTGRSDYGIVREAVGFLRSRAREDGSWPIDTNLATWVTTLSVSALAAGGRLEDRVPEADREAIRDWLLAQQHRERHPYTAAPPGGWAWTDLPGGVPDADDTAGALLALRLLSPADEEVRRAAAAGAAWLLGLQNADGGVPTFCRGWGHLPFDRSAPDLTAHAVGAWSVWRDDLPDRLRRRVGEAIRRGFAFLARSQRGDGSWRPLWFGNEAAPERANPTYGTARVVLALAECFSPGDERAAEMFARGASWLVEAQGEMGGWGGDRGVEPSVEETAVAVEALAAVVTRADMEGAAAPPVDEARAAAERGLGWLVERAGGDDMPEAAPIGFYFASLWYFERLYPLVFTVAAMERASAAGLSPS